MLEVWRQLKHAIANRFHRIPYETKLADQVVRGEVPSTQVRRIKDVDADGQPVYSTDTDELVRFIMTQDYRIPTYRPGTRFGRRRRS